MHEIGDGNEGGKVGRLERPVPRLTISQERPPRSLVKTATLHFSSHQRPELVAGNHAADTRPNQPLRTPLFPRIRRSATAWPRLRKRRTKRPRFPRKSPGFPRNSAVRDSAVAWISRTSCSTYTRSWKQVGSSGCGSCFRRRAAHRHQAGVLRLLPGLVMDAALPFRPRHDATAIRGDDRQAGAWAYCGWRVCSACAAACSSRCSRTPARSCC